MSVRIVSRMRALSDLTMRHVLGKGDPTMPLRARAISESTAGRPSMERNVPPRIAISQTEGGVLRTEQSEAIMQRLQDALVDARGRGAQDMKLDRAFVEAILTAWNSKSTEVNELRSKFDSEKVRLSSVCPRPVAHMHGSARASSTLTGCPLPRPSTTVS